MRVHIKFVRFTRWYDISDIHVGLGAGTRHKGSQVRVRAERGRSRKSRVIWRLVKPLYTQGAAKGGHLGFRIYSSSALTLL